MVVSPSRPSVPPAAEAAIEASINPGIDPPPNPTGLPSGASPGTAQEVISLTARPRLNVSTLSQLPTDLHLFGSLTNPPQDLARFFPG
jgi:hypothetical protein